MAKHPTTTKIGEVTRALNEAVDFLIDDPANKAALALYNRAVESAMLTAFEEGRKSGYAERQNELVGNLRAMRDDLRARGWG